MSLVKSVRSQDIKVSNRICEDIHVAFLYQTFDVASICGLKLYNVESGFKCVLGIYQAKYKDFYCGIFQEKRWISMIYYTLHVKPIESFMSQEKNVLIYGIIAYKIITALGVFLLNSSSSTVEAAFQSGCLILWKKYIFFPIPCDPCDQMYF